MNTVTNQTMPEITQESSFIRELATFISELTYNDLPPEAVENVEHCFLDTIGVALAGSCESAGKLAGDLARSSSGGSGPATLWGRGCNASVIEAIFANGTSSHTLDYDDVTPAKTGHPSAPMVAPLLAIAQKKGDQTGEHLLAGYVAGFETQALIGEIINPKHYQLGWHSTATMGTFGSTAATGSLLDLSADQMKSAINIAASMSSGLIRNFGSMTKPLHAGQAARCGATAALLAADGFTSAEDAITGERGFLDLYYGDEVVFPQLPSTGSDLMIATDGVFFKKYPSCNRTHTSIAAAIHLVEENDISFEEIETIRASTSQRARDILHHDDPKKPLEGKFSLPYTIANAIVHRHVGLETFTKELLADSDVRSVQNRVIFNVDPEIPYESYEAQIQIETSDRTFSHRVVDPPGQYSNPLTRSEIKEKFHVCASQAIEDPTTVAEIADLILELRNATIGDVNNIANRL